MIWHFQSSFTPSIVQGLGYTPAHTQLMTVPPFALAFVRKSTYFHRKILDNWNKVFTSWRHLCIHIRSLPLPWLGIHFLLNAFRHRFFHVLGIGKEKHSICFPVLFDSWMLHRRTYAIHMERQQHCTTYATCNSHRDRVYYDEFRRDSCHLAPRGSFICAALLPWHQSSSLLLGDHGSFQRLQRPVFVERKPQKS